MPANLSMAMLMAENECLKERVRFLEDILYHSAGIKSENQRYNHNLLLEKISNREKEIIVLLSDGLSAKMISEKLNISIHTVCTHRKNLLKKLNLHNVASLVSFAAASGI